MPSEYRYVRYRVLSLITYARGKAVDDVFEERRKGVVRYKANEDPAAKVAEACEAGMFDLVEIEYLAARAYHTMAWNGHAFVPVGEKHVVHEPRRPG